MARKATITKEEIVDAAFRITRKEGFQQITSRKLASEAGCSTQPIFRLYANMEALKKDVYDKAASYYGEFYAAFEKKNEIPFVDLGMAYISFARKEPKLFELLFLMPHEENAKSTYELVNGADDAVTEQIRKAGEGGTKSPDQLFMKIWIFIHGAACMAVSGDYDLDEEQSLAILKSCYKDFAG